MGEGEGGEKLGRRLIEDWDGETKGKGHGRQRKRSNPTRPPAFLFATPCPPV